MNEISPESLRVDTRSYAASVTAFDFGLLNARNQLIVRLINPLLDMLLLEPLHDHVTGSETLYDITIYLKSHRQVDDNPEI